MNESDILEQKIRREILLKDYRGPDRVIHAEERFSQIAEEEKNSPKFSALMGMPSLDECTAGFRPGQLVIVSGPPKNGKTLFCQNLTARFTSQGHRCLWFEYELSGSEFLKKFPAGKLDFYVPADMVNKNLDWVEDRVIESKQKFSTDIVFIDHLDFLREHRMMMKNLNMNMSTYIGAIIQGVKTMAVQHNVLIFLMSHIRKNEWTSGKLPTSEELSDSRHVAQLADTVMMVMRKRNKENGNLYHETDAIIGVIESRQTGKTKMVDVQLHDGEFYESTDKKLNEPIKKIDDWIL